MQIILYQCTAENERVNKSTSLANPFVLQGTLRDPSSVVDPVITIEKTNPVKFYYNYMFIQDFKRYYFINDFRSINNKLWEIHAHVDVLYSHMAAIKSMKCIIDKSQMLGTANLYMDDGSFVMDSRKYTEIKQFPNGLDENGQYILICAGGAGS